MRSKIIDVPAVRFLLVLALSCLVSGAGSASPSAAPAAAVPGPALRVGSEVEFPPFASLDEAGKPAGFSVDLIKAVADTMGMAVTFTTGPWDMMWNGLVSGDLDVLPIVSMSSERQRVVDFSLPHTETFDAFFILAGKPSISNIEAAQGKEIVVMRSDAAHHALEARSFQGKLVLVDTIPEGLSLVASGKHDAFLCSKLIGSLAVEKHGIKGVIAGPVIPDYKRVFAFGVRKGADELREKLNQGLMIVKSNGEYRQIYEKWLAADDPWVKYRKTVLIAVLVVAAVALGALTWTLILGQAVKRRTAELAAKNAELEKEVLARREAEEALGVSEERFNLAVRAAQEGVWDWNMETDEVWYSSRYKEMLGYSEDEIEHHVSAWLRLLHPDDKGHSVRVVEEVMRGERDYEIEFRMRHKDGHYLHILSRGFPVRRDSDGKIVRIVGTHFDLTERKKAETDLEHMRHMLSEGQKIAHLGTFEYDAETRTTVWSEEEYRIYGLDPSGPSPSYQVMLANSIHPEDAALLHRTFTAAIQSNSVYELEHRIVRPDGSVRWVYERAHPYCDEHGKLVRYIGSTLDVTEHKRARDDLNRIMREQRIILDTANVCISLVRDRKQVWVNRKTEEMFQYSKEELVNQSTQKLYPSQEAYERLGAEAYPVLARGLTYETVQELVRRDGSHIWVRYNGKAIAPSDMSAGTLWILEDITEHKKMEEALRRSHEELEQRVADRTTELTRVNQKLRQEITERKLAEEALHSSLAEKVALLKEVHHRVKNNLQIVSSLLGLQLHRTTDPQVVEALRDTRNRVASMALLHEKLYRSQNLASIDFPMYLKDLCGHLLLASAPSTKRIEVLHRLAPIGLPLEQAVPCALIVSELFANALKHGFPGDRTGTIVVGVDLIAEGSIVLTVQDDGIGLSPDFDPKSTSTLGLQIVSALATQLEGQFEAGPSDGAGAIFRVTFPLPENGRVGGAS